MAIIFDCWPEPLSFAPTLHQALALADEIAIGWKDRRPASVVTPELHRIATDLHLHGVEKLDYYEALTAVEKETMLWVFRWAKANYQVS